MDNATITLVPLGPFNLCKFDVVFHTISLIGSLHEITSVSFWRSAEVPSQTKTAGFHNVPSCFLESMILASQSVINHQTVNILTDFFCTNLCKMFTCFTFQTDSSIGGCFLNLFPLKVQIFIFSEAAAAWALMFAT